MSETTETTRGAPAKYYLHVKTENPKTGLAGKRAVGGGLTIDEARENADLVLERDATAAEIVITGPVDDKGTVGEVGRVTRE